MIEFAIGRDEKLSVLHRDGVAELLLVRGGRGREFLVLSPLLTVDALPNQFAAVLGKVLLAFTMEPSPQLRELFISH